MRFSAGRRQRLPGILQPNGQGRAFTWSRTPQKKTKKRRDLMSRGAVGVLPKKLGPFHPKTRPQAGVIPQKVPPLCWCQLHKAVPEPGRWAAWAAGQDWPEQLPLGPGLHLEEVRQGLFFSSPFFSSSSFLCFLVCFSYFCLLLFFLLRGFGRVQGECNMWVVRVALGAALLFLVGFKGTPKAKGIPLLFLWGGALKKKRQNHVHPLSKHHGSGQITFPTRKVILQTDRALDWSLEKWVWQPKASAGLWTEHRARRAVARTRWEDNDKMQEHYRKTTSEELRLAGTCTSSATLALEPEQRLTRGPCNTDSG